MRWPRALSFVVGTNLPWLRYGGDFGANAWRPDGGVGRRDAVPELRRTLARLADDGFTHVRWFMLCDGRAGLRPAPGGAPAGLDEFVFRDADAAVDALERAGLRAIIVLFDFHWCLPAAVAGGVQTGGRRESIADPHARARLLEGVVAPILDRYGRHPAVAAWDVMNEPEWVTRGGGGRASAGRVPREAMRAFLGGVVALVHERTAHAATIGSASTRTLPLVEGLGLDVYQAHWYDRLDRRAPLARPVSALGLDRPLLLGEFPTRGSSRRAAEILAAARLAGYAGAFAWSALAGDGASDPAAMASALASLRT
ncbi:MAG TPA: hypothetical protein PKZ08_10605, partial [Vicinamibacterales bacterium]|nr:hypothetical protein [Vicinamibacterales bacterium]